MAQTTTNENGDVVIAMPSPSPSMDVDIERMNESKWRWKRFFKTMIAGLLFIALIGAALFGGHLIIESKKEEESASPPPQSSPSPPSHAVNAEQEQRKRDQELEKEKRKIQDLQELKKKSDEKERMRVQKLIDDDCSESDCDLREDNILSINGIVWPPHIRKLYLGKNEIKELSQKNVDALPNDLIKLDLYDNKGLNFKDVELPLTLQILRLDGIGMNVKALNDLNLSKCLELKEMYISNNNVVFTDASGIPDLKSLELISLDWKTLKSIIDIKEFDIRKKWPALKTVWIKDVVEEDLQQAEEYFGGDFYVSVERSNGDATLKLL